LERCDFPDPTAGGTYRCGVSGGADSTALAVLAAAAGLNITLVHVDHGVRHDSADEADVVAQLAERLGVGFEACRVTVADGPDLEARLRAARHAVLGADALLGHTADDQAETVLLALLRGAGPNGLAGMGSARHPLLALRRAETEQLCAALDLAVVTDPSNTDPRFRRNRIRREVLPMLADVAGTDVVPLLTRAAHTQRELVEWAAAVAAELDVTVAKDLAGAPPPVAAAALRAWWCDRTGSPYGPDRAAVERMLDVARGAAVATDVHAGWRLARSGGRLRLERGTTVGSES
jgi:tRNA(Ile)-lysidine synthase